MNDREGKQLHESERRQRPARNGDMQPLRNTCVLVSHGTTSSMWHSWRIRRWSSEGRRLFNPSVQRILIERWLIACTAGQEPVDQPALTIQIYRVVAKIITAAQRQGYVHILYWVASGECGPRLSYPTNHMCPSMMFCREQ